MRTLARDIHTQIDEQVTINGWLHKKRLLGGLNFINVRDRSGLVQVLIQEKSEIEKLRGLQIGSVLEIKGKVISDKRAPGGAEIHEPGITVIVPVTDEPPIEVDKSISHKSENLDTLFEYRTYGLRNLQETAIFQIQSKICASIRNYFYENDFKEIHTPKLLAAATEGGAEVFKLDYFGQEATLAQSPQFYKQMMVGVFERVFEIAPVYRAEPSATTRHMTEYTSVDGEMGFINLKDLEKFLGELLHFVVDGIWKEYEAELKRWNATKPVLSADIPVIPMQEIHEKYSKANKENTIGEKDLRPDEERWICEYSKKNLGSEAVFVSAWPSI